MLASIPHVLAPQSNLCWQFHVAILQLPPSFAPCTLTLYDSAGHSGKAAVCPSRVCQVLSWHWTETAFAMILYCVKRLRDECHMLAFACRRSHSGGD